MNASFSGPPESPNTVAPVSRRDFLKAGALGALTLSGVQAGDGIEGTGSKPRSLILLMMVGGPSQLETFDPKPEAPEGVRGPFGSISTRLPGVRVNEFLPRIAQRMDRLTCIRSLHHDEAPIHETGLQLIQTGRIDRGDARSPHLGAIASSLATDLDGSFPRFFVLPEPIGPTGVAIGNGQTQGNLSRKHAPASLPEGSRGGHPDIRQAVAIESESRSLVETYGDSDFGRHCLRARRMVQAGVRVVTVNMASTVFRQTSWDAHGSEPFSTLEDYKRTLLPTFDQAFSALIDDLGRLGMLDSTLVVATGEFGRTPWVNAKGGRDHWTRAWSALLAGGGILGGQVIGSTDRLGAEPTDRPVSAVELFGTMARSLGLDPARKLVQADGSEIPSTLEGAKAIPESIA